MMTFHTNIAGMIKGNYSRIFSSIEAEGNLLKPAK